MKVIRRLQVGGMTRRREFGEYLDRKGVLDKC